MARSPSSSPSPSLDAIEAALHDLIPRLLPDPGASRGRPPILPAALPWSALLVSILRGAASQVALWRLVASTGLWDDARVPVSASAVYQRLRRDGPAVLARLFADATTDLLAPTTPTRTIAPFATDVLVLNESTLDPVARLLPTDPSVARGAGRPLPGTITGLFAIRRQLWRTIQLRDDPRQNEKVVAPDLVATLVPGTLVLADLGYFSFPWFDALTDRGLWWVSRQRQKTSVVVEHVFVDQLDLRDRLVRLLEDQTGDGRWHRSLTNVLDPAMLSLGEVTTLYGRRWDIELAIKLVTGGGPAPAVEHPLGDDPDADLGGAADRADRDGAPAAGGRGGGGGRLRRVAALVAGGPAPAGAQWGDGGGRDQVTGGGGASPGISPAGAADRADGPGGGAPVGAPTGGTGDGAPGNIGGAHVRTRADRPAPDPVSVSPYRAAYLSFVQTDGACPRPAAVAAMVPHGDDSPRLLVSSRIGVNYRRQERWQFVPAKLNPNHSLARRRWSLWRPVRASEARGHDQTTMAQQPTVDSLAAAVQHGTPMARRLSRRAIGV